MGLRAMSASDRRTLGRFLREHDIKQTVEFRRVIVEPALAEQLAAGGDRIHELARAGRPATLLFGHLPQLHDFAG